MDNNQVNSMDSLMKKLADHNDTVNRANPGWCPYTKTPDNFIKFNESFPGSIVIDAPNPELRAHTDIRVYLQSDCTFLITTQVGRPLDRYYLDDIIVAEDQVIEAVLDIFKQTLNDAVQDAKLHIRKTW